MDYLSPTHSIICFTLQGSAIKRNLIVHIPFPQGKVNDAFRTMQFRNKNAPSSFQKTEFCSAERGKEAC
jgi:hypothetical protein